jgi:hypothetical protein
MNGLSFTTQAPPITVDPNRSDVACFVGFIGRRSTPVPATIIRWLTAQGWTAGPHARSGAQPDANGHWSLLEVPVPIESWEVFDALYAWETRPVAPAVAADPVLIQAVGSTYLGAAIRSFFIQGGRRCYVVRVGDPWPFSTAQADRWTQVDHLIPGYLPENFGTFAARADDRDSWRGIAHLFGLSDVSFVGLPDLADAIANDPDQLSGAPPVVEKAPEQFVTCSAPQAAPVADNGIRYFPAPRCGESGYRAWVRAIHLVAALLERQAHQISLRTVQLIAAVPLPQSASPAAANLLNWLEGEATLFALSHRPDDRPAAGIASRFIQLVYPWVRTPGATNLPEQLESPEGVMIGMLARNALLQGTYRSAATLPLTDVTELVPLLPRSQRYQPSLQGNALIERISLLGPTPNGLRLLSDVTTSRQENTRPASVHRLISVILRAARLLGEALMFEASGETLWAQLEESLRGVMQSLLDAGALRGSSAAEAFVVRCDRSTMTQADLDNGRVIARIQFAPALPVEQITIVLTLNDNVQIRLLPTILSTAEAA